MQKKTWRWPHQLKRPRAGWLRYCWWVFLMCFVHPIFRDAAYQPRLVTIRNMWSWLNPFTVKVR